MSGQSTISGPVYGEDHEAFRAGVQDFLAREVAPSYEEWTADGAIPSAVWASVAAQGIGTVVIPEDYGGGGVDDVRFDAVVLQECLRQGLSAFALLVSRHADAARWLTRHGTGEQRDRWLPGLADGSVRAGVADGDSIMLGVAPEAQLLTDVPGAASSAVVLVDLGRGPDGGDRGVAVVDTAAPGVSRTPVSALGALGSEGADLTVTDFEVAGTSADLRVMRFRSAALMAVSGARAALGQAVAYVNDRRVFGTPVAAFGNTRDRLTRLAAELEAAEAAVDATLTVGDGRDVSASSAALAGLSATAVHDAAVDLALQLHGGSGYMREYPIARAYADARYLRLQAGIAAMVASAAPALGLVGEPARV